MQSPLSQEGLPTNCRGDVCNPGSAGLTGTERARLLAQQLLPGGHNFYPPRPRSPPQPCTKPGANRSCSSHRFEEAQCWAFKGSPGPG